MAKHLDKFTSPFQESRIPFLLAELLTNGQGGNGGSGVPVRQSGSG